MALCIKVVAFIIRDMSVPTEDSLARRLWLEELVQALFHLVNLP